MGLQPLWLVNRGQEPARLLCALGWRSPWCPFFRKACVRVKTPLVLCDDAAHDKFAITSAS